MADRCQDDQQLEELDYQIGMAESPEEQALQALRAHQEVMGMRFADPDAAVAGPDDGQVPGWMTRDEEFG